MPGATMTIHHVFLVPGFFGFAHLGELTYFAHVPLLLERELAARGVQATTHYVDSRPTASLLQRAAHLAELADASTGPDDPIHLVGHSSGGLDARLLVAPGLDLPASVDVPALARRVRSVVTVSAPNHGTPLAALFASVSGQRLLRLLSLASIDVLRHGRVPISAALRLLRIFARLRRDVWPTATVADQVFDQLLADFSPERQAALREFFADVSADQALLTQLTPEAVELLDAALRVRGSVRTGCIVTRTRPPRLATWAGLGLDPYALALHAIYRRLHATTAAGARSIRRDLTPAQRSALLRAYGDEAPPEANDGVVPTRSQVWGDVILACWADHLDVIGHFDGPGHAPPHFDWMPSGSSFSRRRFERLWAAVAAFQAGARG